MPEFIKQIYKKADASSKTTVFIDRDGTLNKENDYICDSSQIELLPKVIDGIKKLNKYGIVIVVITNQPVIARGLATIKEVKKINDTLVELLNRKNAFINAVYFCPHHPERNHPDIPTRAIKYRIECKCRKPGLAMLESAIEDFKINLKSAYLIGNTTRDIQTGKNLGIPTILVKPSAGGDKENTFSIMADYTCNDLGQAADIIIHQ